MKLDPFVRLREVFSALREDADAEAARARLVPILLSLTVAFVLWFTVSMRETYTVSLDSTVRVLTLPEGEALRTPPPRTVRVQYQGVGWDLFGLTRNPPPIPVFADGPEVNLLGAAAESAQLPVGVTVQSVQPQTIQLDLDPALTRRLPIRLAGALDFEPGYGLLYPPRLDPDTVEVRGARSVLQAFDAWPTAPLDLGNLRHSLTASVPLSDTLGALVGLSLERTLVALEVAQFTEGSRLLDVRVEGVPPGVLDVRLIPSRVRATYLVPIEGPHFERAETSPDFYAVVDYADIARDTTAGAVPVTPHVPEGLLVQEVRLAPRRLEYYTVRE